MDRRPYLSFGTTTYDIPLPKGYKLKCWLPLRFIFSGSDFIIECPFFDEYGYGKTTGEAMEDLGSSIVDLWDSLKRLKKRRKNLGLTLRQVYDNLESNVVKV